MSEGGRVAVLGAGAFGTALAVGWAVSYVRNQAYDAEVAAKLPALRQAGPDAIVLADGFSCRKQVSDLTLLEAHSLAEVLAAHRRTPEAETPEPEPEVTAVDVVEDPEAAPPAG